MCVCVCACARARARSRARAHARTRARASARTRVCGLASTRYVLVSLLGFLLHSSRLMRWVSPTDIYSITIEVCRFACCVQHLLLSRRRFYESAQQR